MTADPDDGGGQRAGTAGPEGTAGPDEPEIPPAALASLLDHLFSRLADAERRAARAEAQLAVAEERRQLEVRQARLTATSSQETGEATLAYVKERMAEEALRARRAEPERTQELTRRLTASPDRRRRRWRR